MFLHLFKYRFLTLMRDRTMIFWTLVFPIVLATFFNLALGNLGEHEKFNTIKLGVVNNDSFKENFQFQETIQKLSSGDEAMFDLLVTNEKNANELLLSGELTGYIIVGNTMKVVVNQLGINQSIIKIFLDQYSQTTSAIRSIIIKHPEAIELALNEVNRQVDYTVETSVSNAEPNNILMYFYSLIAMACLYGSFFGLREVTHIQANLSSQAARMNMAPVHKLKSFIYSSTASLSILFTELLVLMAYLVYGLGVDFGPKIGFILLTVFVGSIVGMGMGSAIAAVFKGSEDMKIGMCIGITMLGSFLAGMMVSDIKYIIDKNAPLLGLINPVNVLTDAFYSLYYYDNYNRYIFNMTILISFALVFCTITYLVLRRKKYASI